MPSLAPSPQIVTSPIRPIAALVALLTPDKRPTRNVSPVSAAMSKSTVVRAKPPAKALKENAAARIKAGQTMLRRAVQIAARAQAELDRPRQTNTRKRATEAEHALRKARRDLAFSGTLQQLGAALVAGTAGSLSGIRQASVVERLLSYLPNWHRVPSPNHSDRAADIEQGWEDALAKMRLPRYTVSERQCNELIEILNKSGTQGNFVQTLSAFSFQSAYHAEVDVPMAEAILRVSPISAPEGWRGVRDVRRQWINAGMVDDATVRAVARELLGFVGQAPETDLVKTLELALVGEQVGIDFFPTPHELAQQMVQQAIRHLDAQVTLGSLRACEPQAGNGHIAVAMERAGLKPQVAEISDRLRAILQAKGFEVIGWDFLDVSGREFDVIIANPPFGKLADIDHTRHAYSLLASGGVLVTIVGEGAFGQGKKPKAFQAWLDELGAEVEKLPPGSFADPTLLKSTQANARLVTLTKP